MPELFVIPMPVTANIFAGLPETVIVNAVAPGLKKMPLTSVSSDTETLVELETPNVAVSTGPFGTVTGVQFVGVFQIPLPGSRFQVALAAEDVLAAESAIASTVAAEVTIHALSRDKKISCVIRESGLSGSANHILVSRVAVWPCTWQAN
jgi:hypothetical protein